MGWTIVLQQYNYYTFGDLLLPSPAFNSSGEMARDF